MFHTLNGSRCESDGNMYRIDSKSFHESDIILAHLKPYIIYLIFMWIFALSSSISFFKLVNSTTSNQTLTEIAPSMGSALCRAYTYRRRRGVRRRRRIGAERALVLLPRGSLVEAHETVGLSCRAIAFISLVYPSVFVALWSLCLQSEAPTRGIRFASHRAFYEVFIFVCLIDIWIMSSYIWL